MKCSISDLALNIHIKPAIIFLNETEILPEIKFNISEWTNKNRVFTISFNLHSDKYFRVNYISLDILRNK